MCASETRGSSHNGQPSIYRSVNWALFSFHSEVKSLFGHSGSLRGVAEAPFFLNGRRITSCNFWSKQTERGSN